MPTVTLPPGPKGRLLDGNLADFRLHPLDSLRQWAQDYGDFVPLRLGFRPAVLLSHPDYLQQVLVTHSQDFRKSPMLRRSRVLLGEGLLTNEGDSWLRQRQLIQPAFHRDRLAAYGQVMASFAQQRIDSWKEGEILDVHGEMMRLTLEIAAKTLCDAEVASEAQEVAEALGMLVPAYIARTRSLFSLPDQIPTPRNRRLLGAVRRLDKIIFGILERRRKDGDQDRGDLLSMLLQARYEDGSRMTDRQLRDEVMTLLMAGHETTAIALSWALYLLSQHPEVESRLVAELRTVLKDRPPTAEDLPQLRYAERVVMESLRLYPPSWAMLREAVRDFEIAGHRRPRGTIVIMSQWVIHRDGRYFDDPEKFDPDRWADGLARRLPRFAFFPFGGGPRHCIGHSFAMMEASLLLATVEQRFHLEMVPGHPVTPEPSITLRPRYGMRMVPHRRG